MELFFVSLFTLLSAFFSGTETAFLSINRIRLHSRLEAKDPRARVLDRLIRKSEDFISGVLLGSNICDVATVLSLNAFLSRTLGPNSLIPLYSTLILTPSILIFSTLIPKVIFRSLADSIMYPLAYFYLLLYYLLYPLQFIFVRTIKFLLYVFGLKKRKSAFTKGEFSTLLDMTVDKGLLKVSEKKFIEGIMSFKTVRVREIMIPLVRMTCIEENDSVEMATALMLSTRHTRLPVFRMRVDNMIGYIQSKDIINAGKHDKIGKYIRETIFVPDTTPIHHVLARMQDKMTQMAFVVDEYGGVAGVVTNQDIITEILGEFVEIREARIRKEENAYVVGGIVSIDELNEELNLRIEKNDFETVAGFILNRLGRIPAEGEKIEHGKYIFEILSASKVRINKVRITKGKIKGKKRRR